MPHAPQRGSTRLIWLLKAPWPIFAHIPEGWNVYRLTVQAHVRSQPTWLYFTLLYGKLKLKLALAVHNVIALPLNYGQLRIGLPITVSCFGSCLILKYGSCTGWRSVQAVTDTFMSWKASCCFLQLPHHACSAISPITIGLTTPVPLNITPQLQSYFNESSSSFCRINQQKLKMSPGNPSCILLLTAFMSAE